MLAGRTVLVTGSTGFIGCRLVEKLILEHNVRVRALVRNFSRAARIARFPIDMAEAHLTDVEALDRAVAGCEVVFHCAYDWHLPSENIDGIRNLAEACLRHGVQRLVHVSTMAVYEPLPDGDVTEESPAEPCGWTYKDNKLAIEREILSYVRERNLCATILQPTIVYGPFSQFWTVAPVKMLLRGAVVLPAERPGLCNPVYVDDVVDALILAAERDHAVGQRFLISGPEPVTWRDFFGAIERHLGVKSLKFMADEELKCLVAKRKQSLRAPLVRKVLRLIYSHLNGRGKQMAEALKAYYYKKKKTASELFLPDEQELLLYRARGRVSIDKARRVLGYDPVFGFDEGMDLTAQYIRWAFPGRLGK